MPELSYSYGPFFILEVLGQKFLQMIVVDNEENDCTDGFDNGKHSIF